MKLIPLDFPEARRLAILLEPTEGWVEAGCPNQREWEGMKARSRV